MTEMDMRRREVESREKEGAKERATKRKIARDSNVTNLLSSAIGAASKSGSDFLKLMAVPNHKEWYNKFPQLIKDVANIPFSAPLGADGNMPAGKVSGICALLAYPVLPKSSASVLYEEDGPELVSEAVMQAARSQYAAIRKANSGAKNYEYTDLLRYTLAIESVYAFLADACRAYAIANKFDAHNRFVGDQLLRSTGWDSNSVRTNLAQFRATINRYINYIKSFPLPATSTVVSRHVWMFSNVFKDSNIRRSQLFVYTLGGVYRVASRTEGDRTTVLSFKGVHGTAGGSLGSLMTVSDFETSMADLISALQNDPYSAIISGDIIKAYGDVHAIVFNPISADFSINFVYDANTLTQIYGATIVGHGAYKAGYMNVEQVTIQEAGGGAYSQSLAQRLPMCPLSSAAGIPNARELPNLVNIYKDEVTPDDVMVATRLTAALGFVVASGDYSGLATCVLSCGTEIITAAHIYCYDIKTMQYVVREVTSSYLTTVPEDILTTYFQFDWAPALHSIKAVIIDDDQIDHIYNGIIGDICNFASIDNATLMKLHDAASLTLYGLLI